MKYFNFKKEGLHFEMEIIKVCYLLKKLLSPDQHAYVCNSVFYKYLKFSNYHIRTMADIIFGDLLK